ncbi:MAG TPA: DUF503 domain-containing protein [Bacillota bacterium]|nr:DUF503 domain-containing protein [Bacillota bacterium]
MVICAEIECKLYEGQSLKDKRSVIKRVQSKLRKEYNVSVAEIDYYQLWQRIKLGVVAVSNEWTHAEQMMQEVLKTIDSFPEFERTLTTMDRL